MGILGGALAGLLMWMMMGYAWITLTGWHKDNLAGPMIVVIAALAMVLGVGLAGMFMGKPKDRSEK